jgi:hypothetical protein
LLDVQKARWRIQPVAQNVDIFCLNIFQHWRRMAARPSEERA